MLINVGIINRYRIFDIDVLIMSKYNDTACRVNEREDTGFAGSERWYRGGETSLSKAQRSAEELHGDGSAR